MDVQGVIGKYYVSLRVINLVSPEVSAMLMLYDVVNCSCNKIYYDLLMKNVITVIFQI